MGVEVRLLGPVEAAVDGENVELGGPKQRALLALLAAEPGRVIPSGRLAEELWEGSPPPTAETTLRSYVSRLRRALGAATIRAQSAGYVLDLPPDAVDAVRFERLLGEGREALARGAAGIAAERLHAALALWRGSVEDTRLEALELDATEARIDADLALGRHATLVAELRRLVAEEPLRERFWYQLALALYRSGQQAEALAAYREARDVLDRELGLDPGEELRELERAILNQAVAPAGAPDERHNLPAPLTSFVGREPELAEVAALLRAHRLVTLTGVGGTGKTRLANEVGRRQSDAWADGVWMADLTGVASGDLVPGAVAAAIGASERNADVLVEHARGRELLLLLDNCEHVVEACADLAETLLRNCPNVRVLATSRVVLGAHGEADYALEPLDSEAAVQLFLDRAAATRRDVAADEQAHETVETICRELDRLPLSIELAAARAKALSFDEIAARLDDRFRFLRAWRRVADPRHRTLAAKMDWSYDLLADDERRLLRQLSVFAGGATLDAILAVCSGDEELLGRLVDASLVGAEGRPTTRYRLLETVRQYAAVKLAEDADADSVRRRHAEHFLALAEAANLSIESIGRGEQRHEPVQQEQDNLRAALDWSVTGDAELGLRLMVALENFWVTQGALPEMRRRFDTLMQTVDGVDPLVLARAYRDCAASHELTADLEGARERYLQSRELFRAAGDEAGASYVTYRIAIGEMITNHDFAATLPLYEEALEGLRRAGDRIGELQVLSDMGWYTVEAGDESGWEPMEASLELAREVGWHWWYARVLLLHAELHTEAGRLDLAEDRVRTSLPISRRMGNRQLELFGVAIMARLAARRGDDQRALALWATVEATEDKPGRFGRFDRALYASEMPDGPRPDPRPLDEAVDLALS